MASFNKIIIVGYLGRDPESRFTGQGTQVCSFSIATTEKKGQDEVTTWFRVTAWGKLAELCQQYLAKGKQVYIEGRVRLDGYTDKEGNQRQSLEVTASDVRFLSKKDDRAPESEQAGIDDDTIPF